MSPITVQSIPVMSRFTVSTRAGRLTVKAKTMRWAFFAVILTFLVSKKILLHFFHIRHDEESKLSILFSC